MKYDNYHFKYDYVDVPDNGNQYWDIDISGFGKKTNARYIHSCIAPGCPYIEALPRYRMIPQVMNAYYEPIPFPNPALVMEMSTYDKLESITQLYDLRFPFPFHADIEREFHAAIVQSYRNRMTIEDESVDLMYTADGKDKITHQKLIARCMSASVTGFSLLGLSGCGKSSGMNKLLEAYPQVITHHPSGKPAFQQIVYLMVVCPPASNFKVLFNEIGRQIDLALGNIVPTYQKHIEKAKTVGEKSARIAELIELFSIGIIIFDEIQQVDMSSTKENSIESLLTLNNTTNVALAVIGTEEAYKKMFQKRRVCRRLGVYIEASKYCEDRRTFDRIVRNLFQYSWVSEPSEPSPEILDTLHKLTDGVIDQVINLYVNLQYDLAKELEKAKTKNTQFTAVIDANLIKATAERHSLKVRPFKLEDKSDYSNALAELMNTARQIEEQEETRKELENQLSGEIAKRQMLIQQVLIDKLSSKYSKSSIKKMTEKLLNSAPTAEFTVDEAANLVSKMINQSIQSSEMKKEVAKRKPSKMEIDEYIKESHNKSAGIFNSAEGNSA